MNVKKRIISVFLIFCLGNSVSAMFLGDKKEEVFYDELLTDIKSAFYHEESFRRVPGWQFMGTLKRRTLNYLPQVHFECDKAYKLYANADAILAQLSVKQREVVCSFTQAILKVAISYRALDEELWRREFNNIGNRFKSNNLHALLALADPQKLWEEAFPELPTQKGASGVAGELVLDISVGQAQWMDSQEQTISFPGVSQERLETTFFAEQELVQPVVPVQHFFVLRVIHSEIEQFNCVMNDLACALIEDLRFKLCDPFTYGQQPIFAPLRFSKNLLVRHRSAVEALRKINAWYFVTQDFWKLKTGEFVRELLCLYAQNAKLAGLGHVQVEEFFYWFHGEAEGLMACFSEIVRAELSTQIGVKI